MENSKSDGKHPVGMILYYYQLKCMRCGIEGDMAGEAKLNDIV